MRRLVLATVLVCLDVYALIVIGTTVTFPSYDAQTAFVYRAFGMDWKHRKHRQEQNCPVCLSRGASMNKPRKIRYPRKGFALIDVAVMGRPWRIVLDRAMGYKGGRRQRKTMRRERATSSLNGWNGST